MMGFLASLSAGSPLGVAAHNKIDLGPQSGARLGLD
jgi:hypothetical protein